MDDLAGARVGLLAHQPAVPPEMAQAAVDAEMARVITRFLGEQTPVPSSLER